jgi:hypothetical protein
VEHAADDWIRTHVVPSGSIELASDEPWARVWRVPVGATTVWFKQCAPVQAFEPRLTVALYDRWPDRVPEVVAWDVARAWLLLADAGTPIRALGNPPEHWLAVLPRYAELQRGETHHATEHVASGVPDLRVETLHTRYEDRLLTGAVPLNDGEGARLRGFAARFAELCAELAAAGVPASVQHDDLHAANLYINGDERRVLDWGDASIGHPFASLVVTFRFLEETNRLSPDDPWFERLRDAYLEPWGSGFRPAFELAMCVGSFAHAIAWVRQRDALPPARQPEFDVAFRTVLERALQEMRAAG